MKTKLSYDYEHYASTAELPEADRTLVAEAERATRRSHAPYSKFRVGAAARLRSAPKTPSAPDCGRRTETRRSARSSFACSAFRADRIRLSCASRPR